MTLQQIIDLLKTNSAVEDYKVSDDTVKIWVGAKAYKADKQDLIDDLQAINNTEVVDKGVNNGWRVFLA